MEDYFAPTRSQSLRRPLARRSVPQLSVRWLTLGLMAINVALLAVGALGHQSNQAQQGNGIRIGLVFDIGGNKTRHQQQSD